MQNKRRLFIIGASGFGREVEQWLNLIPIEQRDWKLSGFLDPNGSALDNFKSDLEIVGDERNFVFSKTDLVILAIADPQIKKRIYLSLKDKVDFFTYIAPNAVIGKYCIIGLGSIICPNCILTTHIKFGKFVTLNTATNIGHDVSINDFTSLMANVDIAGFVKIGKGTFIGTKSTVIPSRKIGDNSTIGAGSVVIRNVKDSTTVFGNPAIRIN